jgi:hypothetical protein
MDRGDVIMPVAENVPVAEVEFDESKSPSPPQEMTVTPRQANKTNEKNLFIDNVVKLVNHLIKNINISVNNA